MLKVRQSLLVLVLYAFSGWVGIEFAGIGEGSITLIWLPSGIGLAACIIYGKSILPAIWLGSFIANTPYLISPLNDSPILYACFFGALAATINTFIQAYFAYYLYKKYLGKANLESSRLIIDFVLKVTLLPSALNMALLITLYSIGGYTTLSTNSTVVNVLSIWLSGALADFHGYFVIVPFLLSWSSKKGALFINRKKWLYLSLFSFIVLMVSAVYYVTSTIYLLLVLGVLIALYLNMRIATAFVLATSLCFTFATAQRVGPFNLDTNWHSFVSLLIFVFSLGLSVYVIATKRYELKSAHAKLEEKVKKRTFKLNQANKKLTNMSRTDGLTGIANRRHFDYFLENEWARAIRNHSPISLLIIDIDYFKQYNDIYGHVKGDECLKLITSTAQRLVHRPSDLIARYGGEEFAVILPETTETESLAQHIRTEICSLKIPHEGSDIYDYVSVSIGCCTIFPKKGTLAKHLIELTDKALYNAKDAGRNNVKTVAIGLSSVSHK
ncbi:sensor domain-containing diguanylate cyclase [Colwellia piezophila]|uniref:sensor domain-containing diguanylate cyclase n=1 Tax=Colwellia piezophila TaxID=211668 RepID=UPI0003635278|nr:diguanylate cyclase [Colwellia piezophila]